MKFRSNQTFTKLGTTKTFYIIRPEGFPEGVRGLVFTAGFDTGFGDERRMVIRDDAPTSKWRIDRHVTGKLFEAVPGLDGLYDTPEAAAQALVKMYR